MKVALVESSKSSGHAGRGIGVYTENLKKYLPKYGVELVALDQNPDLIHYPQWDYLSFDWLKLFSDKPIVLTIHDVIPLEFPDHYPLGIKANFNLPIQKILLNQAKSIITDSVASVRSLHKYLNIPHSKLKYIYLGIDSRIKPTSQKPKTKLPSKYAVYTGGINWNKNLVNLTKACLELNLPLVIVGREATNIDNLDTNEPELRHIADLQKLWQDKNIYRLGFVEYEELNRIINHASVCCQVSYAEGFGFAVLEAMKVGTPVVASNTHSLPEICGEYATYCDPWNLDSIKSAIQKSCANHVSKSGANHASKSRANLSPKSRANHVLKSSANHKYSWDKTASQTVDVYNQILAV